MNFADAGKPEQVSSPQNPGCTRRETALPMPKHRANGMDAWGQAVADNDGDGAWRWGWCHGCAASPPQGLPLSPAAW